MATRDALVFLQQARTAYLAAVREVLDVRRFKCSKGCRGWVISVVDRFPGVEIEVCDECAVSNGWGSEVADMDVAALPEAQDALATHPLVVGEKDF